MLIDMMEKEKQELIHQKLSNLNAKSVDQIIAVNLKEGTCLGALKTWPCLIEHYCKLFGQRKCAYCIFRYCRVRQESQAVG